MENRETFSEEIKKIFEDMKNTPEDQQQITHNGVLYPSGLCSSEIFEALSTFEAREDDIFMVAYPKCGTNWTVLMLQDMVYVVYNKNPSSLIPLIEFGGPGKYEKLKEESSPRILATHLHYDNIPKSFIDKKTKMLVVFRNPKDTALSYYHFYNNNPKLPTYTSWDTFFQDFMSGNVCWGSYFDQAIAWNKHIDDDHVMIITYEAMKEVCLIC
ncbi:hypothetical protein GDO86_009378 [Hymenochirus boettgeri]|uniref:Sulfotransferase n=1 Tax=Hymenochirus boettgeri TaxID=247094 RepID=A0A8T2JIQ8_9PIPI|nr:hypothetical protein GDO86_009378 [Hymenochirus boettgeri]